MPRFRLARSGYIPPGGGGGEPPLPVPPAPQGHRPLAAAGAQLPDYVQRQSAIQGLIGGELGSVIAGTKSVDQALADAERQVDELQGLRL